MQWVLFALLPAVLAQKAPAPIPDGPRGGGPVFSKCGGSLFGGKDICYEVTVNKLQFQIGADGTDDDVSVKICDDQKKNCCDTGVLSSRLSDDFSKNDLETWKKSKLGGCKDKKFKIKKGLDISVNKKGTDTLSITSLFVEAETINKDKKVEAERFECGSYALGGKADARNSNSTQSKFCKTSAYEYERVKVVNVTIGPDGTDDDTRIEICSNVNGACCRTKLSSLLSDDWSKNSVEVWKEGDLGKCKTMLYKVNKVGANQGLKLSVIKKDNSKDDLIVNKIVVSTEGVSGAKYQYDCKGYTIQSQVGKTKLPCVPGQNCSQTNVCLKFPATKTGVTTRRPVTNKTTRRSQRIATSTRRGLISQQGAKISTTTKKTTTRPPFRSTSG